VFWCGSMGRFLSAAFILDKGCSEEDFIRSLTSSWSRSDVKILQRQQPLLPRFDSGGWWPYKQAMARSLSGIIIGDVLRRLVARNLVQQYATTIHTACAPHQLGTETVVRTISVATQSNPQHTVLSVDDIGAYDTISRNSMQQGLVTVPIANRCFPLFACSMGNLRSTFGTTKLGNHTSSPKGKAGNKETH